MFEPLVNEGIFIAVIAVITWIIWDYLDSKNQPPGPSRFPFFGNLFQVAIADPIPYIGLYKICKRYGKHGLTRIQLGFINAVFLNDVQTMKDLINREETFSREFAEEIKARNMNKNLGILIGVGHPWKEMRRFTLKTLKNFGFSKRSVMGNVMSSEANLIQDELIQMSKSSKDGTIRIVGDFFAVSTLNIVLWMVTGKRCDRNDKNSVVNRFLVVGRKFSQSFSMISGLYNYWPFLKNICPQLCGFTQAQQLSTEMQDIAREMLYEARASGNYKTSQNCFIDEFLAQIDEEEKKRDGEERFFTDDQFIIIIMDLIQAGSDTTSGSLAFGILLLASHPTVQEKLVQEIIRVVGLQGVPCLEDRDKLNEVSTVGLLFCVTGSKSSSDPEYGSLSKVNFLVMLAIFNRKKAEDENRLPNLEAGVEHPRMPYTQAVIAETLRYARTVMLLPRNVLKDFWYQGFHFKKGTTLMMCAHTINMDEDVWGDPDNFRPERFIKDGSFNKEFADENTLPFGTGRRSCIGEGIARDALFIMLTTLIRNLDFSLPEGRPKPSLIPVLGFSALAAPFDVVINPRK
ncbi:Farnesoate epoxidase [Folsomia candida]|uniref:Farnesoate epoxidase n=1 Tax=Folsomia candida TaxID=158441 RepID=A0A226EZ60_FOLCA|nr:Farnesoate epoxidase [Folsomia candida]